MADFRVIHKTHYIYDDFMKYSQNMAHMYPLTFRYQDCFRTHVNVTPKPSSSSFRRDYFGNQVFFFSLEERHKELEVSVESIVRTHPPMNFDLSRSTPWEKIESLLYASDLEQDMNAIEFLQPSPLVAKKEIYAEFLRPIFIVGKPVYQGAMELSQHIFNTFKFDNKATTVNTPTEQVLREKKGVCQDFTLLCIAALRSIGVPARYMSGYLETIPPPGEPKLQGSDATHAWFSVYCPDMGWLDFDPTNGKGITEEYITTAIGRDYTDISPLRGVLFGTGKNKLTVAVDVFREEIIED